MLKWIATVKRRDGVSHDEIVGAWESVHIPHIMKVVKPLRYRVTFFDSGQPNVDFDGTAELTFRDREHFDTAIGAKAPPELRDDGFGDYIAPGGLTQIFTREYVNVDGETMREDVKISFFAKRRPDVPLDKFLQHWREVHLPNVKAAVERTPTALRYVVNLAEHGDEGRWDGMASIWFRDPNATLADLGLSDDGYIGLVSPEPGDRLAIRGHEIVAIA